MTPKNSGESYNDAVAKKEQALTMSSSGSSPRRAGRGGRAFLAALPPPRRAQQEAQAVPVPRAASTIASPTPVHGELLALPERPRSLGHFNQLFHRPLHRQPSQPTRDSTIVDITCDSDGKIDSSSKGETVDETIALHPLPAGDPYTGHVPDRAYQDINGRHAQPLRA